MEFQITIESIRKQISEGEIKVALDELRVVYQALGERTIDVDTQKGKLSDINRYRRSGIVSNEDFQLEIWYWVRNWVRQEELEYFGYTGLQERQATKAELC